MRETVRALQQSGHQLLAMRAEQHLLDLDKQRSSLRPAIGPPAEVLLSSAARHFRNGDGDAAETQWKAASRSTASSAKPITISPVYLQTGGMAEAEAAIKAAEKSASGQPAAEGGCEESVGPALSWRAAGAPAIMDSRGGLLNMTRRTRRPLMRRH